MSGASAPLGFPAPRIRHRLLVVRMCALSPRVSVSYHANTIHSVLFHKAQVELFQAVLIPRRLSCLAAIYAALDAGADVQARNSEGLTALHLAAERNENPAAVAAAIKVLVAEGADVRAKDSEDGAEPLHLAAQYSSGKAAAAAIAALLDAGADVRAADQDGGQPIHRAAQNDSATAAVAAIKALVERGADVRAKDGEWGAEPLHYAAWNDNGEAAQAAIAALLDAGAAIHAADQDGMQPIHYAAENDSAIAAAAAVKALVRRGAHLRAKDTYGHEPLHLAAANDNPAAAAAAAEALLAAGADLAALDGIGKAPLELVLERPDAASCHRLLRLLAGGSGAAVDGKADNSSGAGEAQAMKLAAAGVRELRKRQVASSGKQRAEASCQARCPARVRGVHGCAMLGGSNSLRPRRAVRRLRRQSAADKKVPRMPHARHKNATSVPALNNMFPLCLLPLANSTTSLADSAALAHFPYDFMPSCSNLELSALQWGREA